MLGTYGSDSVTVTVPATATEPVTAPVAPLLVLVRENLPHFLGALLRVGVLF